MVKQRKKNSRENPVGKGFKKNRANARKIKASTGFDTCTEQLSPFGGLLGLIKFLIETISRLVAIPSWVIIRWRSVF